MVLVLRVRKGLSRFLAELDAEAVGLFQAVFYFWFIIGGVYLLAISDIPIQSVEEALGPVVSLAWAWLNILGPVTCLVGKRLKGPLTYTGKLAQLVGDVIASGATLVYVSSIVSTSEWGKGVWGAFLAAATFCCLVLLTIRDIRRLLQVEREVRR